MKSIHKAIDILEVFISENRALSLSEIANLTSNNSSTVHGIVSALANRGYLIQNGKRGKYFLGYKQFELVEIAKVENVVWQTAYPYMRELNNLVDETTTLAVLNKPDKSCIIIEQIRSSQFLSSSGGIPNVSVPLYNTGVGKVFLAHFEKDELDNYIARTCLKQCTPYTVTDPAQLKKELAEIRKNGMSIDNQGCELGITEIAAPLKDKKGNLIAALGILGSSIRMKNDRMQDLQVVLKRYAALITNVLR